MHKRDVSEGKGGGGGADAVSNLFTGLVYDVTHSVFPISVSSRLNISNASSALATLPQG